MTIFFLFLSIIVLTRTISYSIFEIKSQNNTFGGIVLIVVSVITFLSTIVIVIRDGGFWQPVKNLRQPV